jgi:MFS family permease
MLVLIGSAVNWLAVAKLRRLERVGAAHPAPEAGALRKALRRPSFWMLAAIFGLAWLNHGILLTYVLLLFEDRGASASLATFAAACIGPAQVLGRLVLLMDGARLGNRQASILSLAAVAIAGAVLMLAGLVPALIFGFSALQGAGMGLLAILRPMLVADILGRRGFGAISGAASVAPLLATAAAPSVGAALLAFGGPVLVYTSCLGFALLAVGLGVALLRR